MCVREREREREMDMLLRAKNEETNKGIRLASERRRGEMTVT